MEGVEAVTRLQIQVAHVGEVEGVRLVLADDGYVLSPREADDAGRVAEENRLEAEEALEEVEHEQLVHHLVGNAALREKFCRQLRREPPRR